MGGGIAPEGGAAPVYLALTPNPVYPADGGPPGASDLLLAELTTLAVGVRAVVLEARWSALGGDAAAVAALAARVHDYAARGLRVVLLLLAVDGATVLPPPGVVTSTLDDPASIGALTSTVDAVLAAMGPELAALVVGRDVDRFAEIFPAQAPALAALLGAAVARVANASGGDMAAPLSAVGLTFPPAAVPGAAEALLALGEAAAFTYFPSFGATQLAAEISPAKDLDAIGELAGMRPTLLLAVGHPSSAALGGSPDLQAQFLSSFFTALAPRRADFPFVSWYTLHDLPAAPCDALALAQGGSPDDPAARYLCTAGLRTEAGLPKPAWQGFVQAAAGYASP
jgi:hypothetical protein